MLSLGSWAEILIIIIVAVIVIKPKDLPQILKACGRFIFKIRQFTDQFQHGFNDFINAGQIEEYEENACLKATLQMPLIEPKTIDTAISKDDVNVIKPHQDQHDLK